MQKQLWGLIAFGLMLTGIFGAWYGGFLPSFSDMQSSKDQLHALAGEHPVVAPMLFLVLYIAVVALSLPVATVFSLLSGFLFGVVLGTFVVVLGATIGAVLIFVLARFFFRDFFEAKLESYIGTVPTFGTFTDVFVARLIPAVPFALINVVSGLTRVSLSSYTLATLIGIVPFSFVYVYAGQRLGEINSLHDITSSETVVFLTRIAAVLAVVYLVKRFRDARARATSGV